MSKTALLLLAEGAEEMETVISADVLRRGGVEVTIAGLAGSGPVKCSRQVVIVPDKSLDDAKQKGLYDAVVIPGGLKGAENLAASNKVAEILREHEKAGKLISAICAGPTVLKAHGIAAGKRVTSFPGKKEDMVAGGYQYVEERVVIDGTTITSRGPGTTFEFGLALVEYLHGKEKGDSLIQPMLLKL
jgi:protein DJ-1